MTGDATLFQRHDFVQAAWSAVMAILDVWQDRPALDFPNYPARIAWGPEAADELLYRDGRAWRHVSCALHAS
jgi:glucose-6-phosphate 1-dehydrogenase